MSEQEILENNRLIAEFMGLKEDESFKKLDTERLSKGLPAGSPIYHKDGILTNLRYQFSWDWLIPVLIKIEDIHYNLHTNEEKQELFEEILSLQDPRTGNINTLYWNNTIKIPLDINKVYADCITFIHWYNKNKDKL